MTNKQAHTPGEWRLSGPDEFGDYAIQEPDSPLAIAAVVNGEVRRMGGKAEEHAANARLLRAAPGTLETLIMLRNAVGDLKGGFSQSVDPERWVEEFQAEADAAIRKAKGGAA